MSDTVIKFCFLGSTALKIGFLNLRTIDIVDWKDAVLCPIGYHSIPGFYLLDACYSAPVPQL
jgi:hypothetical protein